MAEMSANQQHPLLPYGLQLTHKRQTMQTYKISNKTIAHYQSLSEKVGLEFIRLKHASIVSNLLSKELTNDYMKLQTIPIKETPTTLTVATSNPEKDNLKKVALFYKHKTKKEIKIVLASLQEICEVLGRTFEKEYSHDISSKNSPISPKLSARYIPSVAQKSGLLFFVLIVLASLVLRPMITLLWINIILNVGISVVWGYKILLALTGWIKREKFPKHKLSIKDADLPIYTILVPLFKEGLPITDQLVNALLALDYPVNKLDIKLLLEKDDPITPDIVTAMNLPAHFHVIYTPEGTPSTKPRAWKYALEFAETNYSDGDN